MSKLASKLVPWKIWFYPILFDNEGAHDLSTILCFSLIFDTFNCHPPLVHGMKRYAGLEILLNIHAAIPRLQPAAISDNIALHIIVSFWPSLYFYILELKIENGLGQTIQWQYRDSATVSEKATVSIRSEPHSLQVVQYLEMQCLEFYLDFIFLRTMFEETRLCLYWIGLRSTLLCSQIP